MALLQAPASDSSASGADAPSGWRRVRAAPPVLHAATALVVGQLVLRGWLSLRGYPYWDDYILQGLASRHGLLDPSLLLHVHDGHVMPGGMVLAWFASRLTPLSPAGITLQLVVLQAVASALVARLCLRLVGPRWLALVPLAVYLFSPLTLPSFLWWSAGLNALPLQIAMAGGASAVLDHLRAPPARGAGQAGLWVLLGLACTEKAVLVGPWLVGLALVAHPASPRDAAADLLRRRRRLLGWALLPCVAYGLAYVLVVLPGSAGTAPSATLALDISRTLLGTTLVPTWWGGPVGWTPVGYASAVVDPPTWWVATSWVLTVCVVLLGLLSRPARRAWAVAGGYVVLDAVALVVARGGAPAGVVVALTPRYVADAAVPLTVAVALTVAGLPGVHRPGSRPSARTAARRRRRTSAPVAGAATVVTAVVVAASLVSSVALGAIWADNPARPIVTTMRADLAAADDREALLPEPVPPEVLFALAYPNNLTDVVLGPLRDRPPFGDTTGVLRTFTTDGRLVPAVVLGEASVPGPDECGWQVSGSRRVPLTAARFPWQHTVRLNYLVGRDTSVRLRFAGHPPVVVPLAAGTGVVFFRIDGGGDHLVLEPVSDDVVCVSQLVVGATVAEPQR